jgi:hypothetical protein
MGGFFSTSRQEPIQLFYSTMRSPHDSINTMSTEKITPENRHLILSSINFPSLTPPMLVDITIALNYLMTYEVMNEYAPENMNSIVIWRYNLPLLEIIQTNTPEPPISGGKYYRLNLMIKHPTQ